MSLVQRPDRTRAPVARAIPRVLVVEDDAPVLTVVTDLLQDAGYGVLQASNGLQAFDHLRETCPDLIILDLMLPGMSGWQFLERAHAQLQRDRIPVVILSAIEARGDYPATLGVSGWLTKPLDVDHLLRAVEELAGPSQPQHGRVASDRPKATARVLLVEDEYLIRDLVIERLTDEGYVLDGVGTIAEARAQIVAARPALILLDLMLPGHSGWDFLRERRDDRVLSGIPVLVISAAPQERLREAKALGADGFLSKPFDLDMLSALVRSFIR